MATEAVVTLKIADMEPVKAVLDATAAAVAEFVKISDEEKAALPEAARTGIDVLITGCRDFLAGRDARG